MHHRPNCPTFWIFSINILIKTLPMTYIILIGGNYSCGSFKIRRSTRFLTKRCFNSLYTLWIFFLNIICMISTKAILLAVLMLMTCAYNMGIAYPGSHPTLTQPQNIHNKFVNTLACAEYGLGLGHVSGGESSLVVPYKTWSCKWTLTLAASLLAASPWTPQHEMPNSLQLDVHRLPQLSSGVC